MYIHLGGQFVVQTRDLIAILDYGDQDVEKKLKNFLDHSEKQGSLVWISKEETKSIVVTDQYIYASPVSSLTLNRRA
jgi:hypothetical protein